MLALPNEHEYHMDFLTQLYLYAASRAARVPRAEKTGVIKAIMLASLQRRSPEWCTNCKKALQATRGAPIDGLSEAQAKETWEMISKVLGGLPKSPLAPTCTHIAL